MTAYLDTSALVPIHVEEPSSRAVGEALGRLSELPTLSDYAVGEFSAVISRYMRMNLMSASEARLSLDQFDDWVATSANMILVETRDIRRATSIVRQFDLKLRMPDALHVAVCVNRELPLVTRDRDMAAAAAALGLHVTSFA